MYYWNVSNTGSCSLSSQYTSRLYCLPHLPFIAARVSSVSLIFSSLLFFSKWRRGAVQPRQIRVVTVCLLIVLTAHIVFLTLLFIGSCVFSEFSFPFIFFSNWQWCAVEMRRVRGVSYTLSSTPASPVFSFFRISWKSSLTDLLSLAAVSVYFSASTERPQEVVARAIIL